MAKKIFISYSHKNKKFAKKVAQDLEKTGHDVWWDITDIEGGDRWAKEIQEGITRSEVFLIIVSPASIISEWVEKEFIFASNRNMKIVPLLYEECELPVWLLNLQYVDLREGSYDMNFQQVLNSVANYGRRAGDAKAEPRKIVRRVKKFSRYSIVLAVAVFLGVLVLILLNPFVLASAPAPTLTPSNTATQFFTKTSEPRVVASTNTTVPPTEEKMETLAPTDAVDETPVVAETSTHTPAPSEIPTFIGLDPAITDAAGAEMLLVESGTFLMGKDASEVDEKPAHIVSLDDYYIDKYEVTNADYKACVDELGCALPKTTTFYVSSRYRNHPVTFVSWENANSFCEWREARLPTEAEWEKAARGTDAYSYPWGNDFNDESLNFCDVECEYSWADKSARDYYTTTAPVGLFSGGASIYGVLDMAGNTAEWVADWYAEDYYENSPIVNPLGPETGLRRVLRGGSWYDRKYDVRTFKRDELRPNVAYNYTGFRCAANAE